MRITLKDFIRIKACFHLEDSSGVCSCLPAMTHLVRYRQLEAQNGGTLNHCKHRQQRKAMCEAVKVMKQMYSFHNFSFNHCHADGGLKLKTRLWNTIDPLDLWYETYVND